MEPSEYENIYRMETHQWWYVGMRDISMRLLGGVYGPRTDLVILDAGMGTGAMVRELGRFGRVVGLDLSAQALRLAARRGPLRMGQADVLALPFADGTFDLVTSFDVLYHQAVDDVGRALREKRRVLKPGGRVLVRLPAYDWLRGHHDTVVHTARRFSVPQMAGLLNDAGFTIERLTYANTLLLPLALGKRMAERTFSFGRSAGTDVTDVAGPLDTLFRGALSAEARWLHSRDLPFGLSVIALAQSR